MAMDHDLVAAHLAFEDPRLGIRECFLTPEIGGARTVAVLSRPLFEPTSEPASIGWVICSSLAMEQLYLQPVEVSLARRLAASGFPVLRFHGQGYGDSELETAHIGLGSHVEDAAHAAGVLARTAGVQRIGLIGARFGATVATLAATEAGAAALVLLQPVTRGLPYMQSLMGTSFAAGLPDGGRHVGAPAEGPAGADVVDVDGFGLRRGAIEEISALDLVREPFAFSGRSLVVQISRSPGLQTDVRHLTRRLAEAGGKSESLALVDPDALKFGLPRYRKLPDGRTVDTQARLTERVVGRVLSWCAEFAAAASPAGVSDLG